MSNYQKLVNGVPTGTAIALTDLPSIANDTALANISGSSTTPSAVSLVSTATPSTIMLRDTNANVQANSFIGGTAVTTTTAGTTTLVVGSAENQIFTGSSTQTIVLPNATTLSDGQIFNLYNQSSAVLSLEFNGGAPFTDASGRGYSSIPAFSSITVTLQTNGTSAGTWAVSSSSTGLGAPGPTVQKFLSGSGTYTTPANVAFIVVEMVGGGGGGGGSGTSPGGSAAGSGGNTTFGTSLLVADGGGPGTWAGASGTGGTSSLGSGPIGIALSGGSGSTGSGGAGTGGPAFFSGGSGASSPFGGHGGGGWAAAAGNSASANSGSGGGGGGGSDSVSGTYSGAGGGAGGYVDAIIIAPISSYSYSVGAGGTAGGAGNSGYSGGAGGSGVIIVTEYYYNGLGASAGNGGAYTPQVTTLTSTGTQSGILITSTTAAITAVAGAVYTNNGNSYTILQTVTASTGPIFFSGTGTTSGETFTLSSGTGTASIVATAAADIQTLATFTTPANASYLEVEMVGGGGGGAASGTGASEGTTAGTATTFGTSLLVANGGSAGMTNASTGALGGSASLGSGPVGIALTGGMGNTNASSITSSPIAAGGIGGSNPFGGAGSGGGATLASAGIGGAGASKTGAGGGGGGGLGSDSGLFSGGGGGAGGYINATITSLASSYSYTVGSGGAGGTTNVGGSAGGAGGSGVIIVTTYFNNGAVGTATGITGSVNSSQVLGTTIIGTAPTGFLGERVSANPGSGVAVGTSAAFVTVASISLTAGDWDVDGTLSLVTGSTTAGTIISGGISLNPTSEDSQANGGVFDSFNTLVASSTYLSPTGKRCINISSTTTIYLVGAVTYTVAGGATWGINSIIQARRVR